MDEEYEEYEESWTGRIVIAAVVAVALIAGAFLAGRALASGPATLAEAVQQAQAGDLPCGDAGTGAAGAADGGAPPAGAADGGAPPAGTPGPGGPPGGAFMARAICGGGQPAAGGAQGARGRFGVGGQTGRVVSVTGTTLTLEGPGGDREVQLSPETTVNTTTEGAASDLKAGQTVIVSGGGQGGQGTATSVLILPAAGAG